MFFIRILINALALWLTTLILSGVNVVAFGEAGTLEIVLTFLLVALLFGIVNGVVGTVIRIVAFPLYILTLGLIAIIINGLLFLLVAWLSSLFGFGLTVDGFWWGVVGALVMGILSWIIGILLRPLTKRHRGATSR